MTELGKCECVWSVMNITSILKMEREKMGDMRILQVIYDGVFVWIYMVYLDVIKKHTLHSFVYGIHLQRYIRVDVVVQLLIIDNMHQFLYCKKYKEKVNLH